MLNELKKDIEGRPFVDLFINTHPHKDHCDGFGTNFFHGAPSEYNKERDKNKIIIGELWVTPRGVGNVLADCAEDIRREAKRRREIYDRDRSYNGGYGNYLRIVGYDKIKNLIAVTDMFQVRRFYRQTESHSNGWKSLFMLLSRRISLSVKKLMIRMRHL